jgi:hypothetical protein
VVVPAVAGQVERGERVADKIAKGIRVVGEQRDALVGELAQRYEAGESIRAIAQDIGRSYGFVHGVLRQSQTPLRGRGGATRGSGES